MPRIMNINVTDTHKVHMKKQALLRSSVIKANVMFVGMSSSSAVHSQYFHML